MKRLLALLPALVIASAACDHEGSTPHRTRTPRSRTQVTCASDYECPGGTCVRERRQTYGMCAWPDGGGPDLERDAGSAPDDPGPDIQPSPSDIHL